MACLLGYFARLARGAPPPPVPKDLQPAIEFDDSGDVDDDTGTDNHDVQLAEGQTFIINYADVKGRLSTRRVTVRAFQMTDDSAYIFAYCHERQAKRTFRVDRIRDIFDLDGTAADDPKQYLVDFLGLPVRAAASIATDAPLIRAYTRLPAPAYPYLQLLTVLARSDGQLDNNEVDCIVEQTLRVFTAYNALYDDAAKKRVADYVRRIYPTERQIESACSKLNSQSPDEITAFIADAKAVIVADGYVHPREIEALRGVFVPLLASRTG